ncbi:hypothetical protein TrST_g6706 [Triparma strigata]|uniref:Uncharacterized protein n=1 Tax=Triparma strigata TaxID=1606541 RepID=A0A9W7A3R0_9STRA|nr:hypothetical protein TrST_g6706 [Triparma strigata]
MSKKRRPRRLRCGLWLMVLVPPMIGTWLLGVATLFNLYSPAIYISDPMSSHLKFGFDATWKVEVGCRLARPQDFVMLPAELDQLDDLSISRLRAMVSALWGCSLVSRQSSPPLRRVSYQDDTNSPTSPTLRNWFYSSLTLPSYLQEYVDDCIAPQPTTTTITIHLHVLDHDQPLLPPSHTYTTAALTTADVIKSIKSSLLPPHAKYVLLFDDYAFAKSSPITTFAREFPDSEIVRCGGPAHEHLNRREQELIEAFVGAGGDNFIGSHHSLFSNGVALLRQTRPNIQQRSFAYSCHTQTHGHPSLTQYNDLSEGCPSRTGPIVGFWHIGPGASHYRNSRESVVQSQFAQIVDSPLFTSSEIDTQVRVVKTVALTGVSKDLLDNDPRFVQVEPSLPMIKGEEYFEYPTLNEVYDFCGLEENANLTVFYFHSKSNSDERIKMNDYLFSKCAQCLEDPKNIICGPNFTPIEKSPWCHFQGNFWMTRCSHVKKLNPPFFEELIYEAHEANRLWPKSGRNDEASPQAGWPHDVVPYGRFFSEYWVTNDVGRRPEHQVDYLEYGDHEKKICLVDETMMCTG